MRAPIRRFTGLSATLCVRPKVCPRLREGGQTLRAPIRRFTGLSATLYVRPKICPRLREGGQTLRASMLQYYSVSASRVKRTKVCPRVGARRRVLPAIAQGFVGARHASPVRRLLEDGREEI